MRTIAIVGGGFSGTVLATMLLRHPPPTPTRLVLIERGPRVGRGVAFAMRDFPYLLNVPVGRMSANPADPLEFLRFMQRRQPDTDAESFLPRAWYGDYLEESLQAASLSAPPHIRLDLIRASVTSIRRNRRDLPLRLGLDDGSELYGDAVVLAVGNPPPRRLAVAQALAGHPAYVEDPWTLSATTGGGDRLFLIGTGLTMVDVVLAAAARADGAHIQALSRHGLIASRQAAFRPRHSLRQSRGGDARGRAIAPAHAARGARPRTNRGSRGRRLARGDQFRPRRGADALAARVRGRPLTVPAACATFWDVHRHRLPEAALARLTHLRQTGRLQVHAGRLESLQLEATGVAVRWRPRGRSATLSAFRRRPRHQLHRSRPRPRAHAGPAVAIPGTRWPRDARSATGSGFVPAAMAP